jgi:hypothetical protein
MLDRNNEVKRDDEANEEASACQRWRQGSSFKRFDKPERQPNAATAIGARSKRAEGKAATSEQTNNSKAAAWGGQQTMSK